MVNHRTHTLSGHSSLPCPAAIPPFLPRFPSPPSLLQASQLWEHFSQAGAEVQSIEVEGGGAAVQPESSVRVRFVSRAAAEWAFANGRQLASDPAGILNLAWAPKDASTASATTAAGAAATGGAAAAAGSAAASGAGVPAAAAGAAPAGVGTAAGTPATAVAQSTAGVVAPAGDATAGAAETGGAGAGNAGGGAPAAGTAM